jgi:hypothetical protein
VIGEIMRINGLQDELRIPVDNSKKVSDEEMSDMS